MGDVDARVHIFTATALGWGRVASPMLDRIYSRYSFYSRLNGPQDQSGHERTKKKNLYPYDTRDRTRAIQPQSVKSQSKLWTTTLDRYTGRASLNVWSAQCQGLRRRQHRTEHRQRIHTQSQDRNKNSWVRRESNPGWKAGTLPTIKVFINNV